MVEEQIRARGLRNERILEVMREIPRESFLPPGHTEHAYADAAISIDMGQTISQPYMVAAMTIDLKLEPHHRVLEIGTGSGYQTAILARLAQHVYTMERLGPLQTAAQERLRLLGLGNVSYRVGDGSLGWPQEAPFDRVLVTAGSPDVPQSLVHQLVEGGRLVIPVGPSREQILTTVERIGGRTREIPGIACRFVKLIGQAAWPEESAE